ncbi:MAG: hypothetical protein V4793_02185 [Paraburkholderia tropica]|uniref:DUF7065 domain-containing protein n=1 Tax=Burkholderia gladioli TaxID=28095 RepID=UPI00050F1BED|nr:hypothetical protein [Burkholderia gladioli]AYQ91804.1 hypothetical protein EDD84_31545 [Burkholderia gladioli]KGE10820.1 hypothetical protein LA03_07685 [Burkholderia gladioli]
MILPEDVRFHTPVEVPYDWAETNFFSIYVPEANITAWVYTIARPGVGALVADVSMINELGRTSLEALYVDFQQHLPMPEKLEDYALPNGLSVRVVNAPRDYQVDYVGLDDTEFRWTVCGLMEPYDIHDKSMDPLASEDPARTGFGTAYASHFDMTVHVAGTLKVRGKVYEVDCISTMDHSWGPRNERGLPPMGWVNASFSRSLAFQSIWTFEPFAKGWQQFTLAHGYAFIEGRVRGLVSGRQRAVRRGAFPFSYEQVLVDIDGVEHHLIGIPVAQHPWSSYNSCMPVLSMMRWFYRGQEGYGQAQENWPLDKFAGLGIRS